MIDYSFLETPAQIEIDRLTELYRQAGWWTDEADNPFLVAGIVAGSHCFLVARQAERIVAMGRAISDRISDAYIQDLTVEREYRNQGIGTRMVETILKRLHEDGLLWIGLISAGGTSRTLYERVGFREMTCSIPMLMI